jgi:hypothetical protein
MSEQINRPDLENVLEKLSKRQDQHIAFMNSLEQIRWQFTSAFGLAAILSLFFLSTTTANFERIAAIVLILIVSLAGLITQIRIVGLFWKLWDKIIVLQKEESDILKESYKVREPIAKALIFPRIVKDPRTLDYLFTVHVANCLVFSSIFGLGLALGLGATTVNLWVSILIGVATTVLLLTISYTISMRYYRGME